MPKPRLLLPVLIALLVAPLAAQTIVFEEDFDAGMPVGWANVHQGWPGDVWGPGFSVVNGTGDVFFEAFCDNGFLFRDTRLVTPPIDLSGLTDASFHVDQHVQVPQNVDFLSVEITTNGGAQWTVLREVTTSVPKYVSCIVESLDAYAGMSNVRLAFHYIGTVASDWSIDNVRVTTGASPWTDLGNSLTGELGEPKLTGTGTLLSGTPGSLDLVNAPRSSAALLFVSIGSTPVPFKGGTLAAFPPIFQLPLGTNAAGGVSLPFLWPAGLPAGTSLVFQHVIADAKAPTGIAMSNALEATTP